MNSDSQQGHYEAPRLPEADAKETASQREALINAGVGFLEFVVRAMGALAPEQPVPPAAPVKTETVPNVTGIEAYRHQVQVSIDNPEDQPPRSVVEPPAKTVEFINNPAELAAARDELDKIWNEEVATDNPPSATSQDDDFEQWEREMDQETLV